MNNYNKLEKIFHKIALSYKIIREVSFDIDQSFSTLKKYPENHIFISGLARSGTTILLNAIYKSNLFASLTYADMPFVLAPNLWSKISPRKINREVKERAHGDGINFSIDSPEAFEEVFWKTFDDADQETFEKFKIYIANILYRYNKERYVSKNNQNIRRLSIISDYFPKSFILIPFRDPIQHANSLLNQHKKFIKLSEQDKFVGKYMDWIGHTEFGPNYKPINNMNLVFKDDFDINHWIEQWYLSYNKCFENLINKKNVIFICYERLCESSFYWKQILKVLNIKKVYEFEFKESKKEINLQIDNQLKEKAFSIYFNLIDNSPYNKNNL